MPQDIKKANVQIFHCGLLGLPGWMFFIIFFLLPPIRKNVDFLQPFEERPMAEFKEFERRFKFKSRFKYGWFLLKLYQMFQDLSRR